MTPIIYLAISAGLVAVDYFIKQWAAVSLKAVQHIDLIPKVLSLHYHQNYGAAFGILQEKRIFLVGLTSILIIGFIVALLLKKVKGPLLCSSFSLIIAGGIGNLIDRIRLGYVIDYIYFEPINFPIFNFADCCVVIGTGLLIIYILFFEEKQRQSKEAAQE